MLDDVNELTTCSFSSPPPSSHLFFLPLFINTDTHVARLLGVCWYDAGGKQSSALNAQSHCCLLPQARSTTTPQSDSQKGMRKILQKLFPNILRLRSTHRCDVVERFAMRPFLFVAAHVTEQELLTLLTNKSATF